LGKIILFKNNTSIDKKSEVEARKFASDIIHFWHSTLVEIDHKLNDHLIQEDALKNTHRRRRTTDM
jgi:hypothetical protein